MLGEVTEGGCWEVASQSRWSRHHPQTDVPFYLLLLLC